MKLVFYYSMSKLTDPLCYKYTNIPIARSEQNLLESLIFIELITFTLLAHFNILKKFSQIAGKQFFFYKNL